MQSLHTLFLLVVVLCLTALLSGCGKKDWPSPVAEQDRFSFQSLEGERVESCLNLQVRLAGRHENLRELVLELEAREEPCPGCPFSPGSEGTIPLSSSKVVRDGPRLAITWCGLEPDRVYRWRLRAVNVYPSIKDAVSEVRRAY